MLRHFRHPYHIVSISPWPILIAFTLLSILIGAMVVVVTVAVAVASTAAVAILILLSFIWFNNVVKESSGGFHLIRVHRGLMVGFLLFLLSEIMLFVSFFWAFFHSSLSPVVELYEIWPPIGIHAVNPWAIPLLGSCVLLASGFVLTLALPLSLTDNTRGTALLSLLITVLLGLLFIIMQFNEYCYGEFTIETFVAGSY